MYALCYHLMVSRRNVLWNTFRADSSIAGSSMSHAIKRVASKAGRSFLAASKLSRVLPDTTMSRSASLCKAKGSPVGSDYGMPFYGIYAVGLLRSG